MNSRSLHSHPNFILIAGTGQNVGKTTLACQIIEALSPKLNLTAVKISKHFHAVEKGQKRIADNPHYRITEESIDSEKDSSRMKNAGAEVSYYIQSGPEYLYEALKQLPIDLKKSPVVCESGGLHYFIKPGLFFLAERNNVPADKRSAYRHNPIRVRLNAGQFNIDVRNICFTNNCFTYNKQTNEKLFQT